MISLFSDRHIEKLGFIKNNNYTSFLVILFAFFIFIVVNRSPVTSAESDPRWTLLVSQSIIENQTIKLDSYADLQNGFTIKKGEKLGYGIQENNGHYYNYFPLGSSISSIPFVWFETQVLGHHMKYIIDNRVAHKQIAALVSVLIFLLLYLIANQYFQTTTSAIIAFLFWSGTSLSSTLGNGLWSHTFAVLYATLALFLSLKIIHENKNILWIILAPSLFMAYLTRPTLSLVSIAIILLLFISNKKMIAVKTTIALLFLLGLFVLFSFAEFNQVLPSYYIPKRLSGGQFWVALLANTFSPSRGIFAFSPFLLLFFLVPKDIYTIFRKNKILIIIGVWIILHLFAISKFPHWSGGFCYGPRFMVDALPGIYLLFIILLWHIYTNGSTVKKVLVSLFLFITIPLSIYFNTSQGQFNRYCYHTWNQMEYKMSEYYFDWNYPQFLHSKSQNIKRSLDYRLKNLQSIPTGKPIFYNSKSIALDGWSRYEKGFVWSSGKSVKIIFKLNDIKSLRGQIKFHIATLGSQRAELYINQQHIGSKVINTSNGYLTYSFDPNILNKDLSNTIQINLPDARKPQNVDTRILSLALVSFEID